MPAPASSSRKPTTSYPPCARTSGEHLAGQSARGDQDQRRRPRHAPAERSASMTRACSDSDIWWNSGRISVCVGEVLGDRQRRVPARAGVRRLPVRGHDAATGGDLGLGQVRPAARRGRAGTPAPTSTQKDWKLEVPHVRVGDGAQPGDARRSLGVGRRRSRGAGRRPPAAGRAGRGRRRPAGRSSGSCSRPRGTPPAGPARWRAGRRRTRSSRARAGAGPARPTRRAEVVIMPPSPVVMILRGWNDQAAISAPAPTGRPR